jgi:hypothetical protein
MLAICGMVWMVRTMYGERSTTTDVEATVTTMGILASVASGATASAIGVRPKPNRTFTLSRTMSSCAMRRAASGTPPSSLSSTSTVRPATDVPRCCRNRRIAALA